MSPLEGSTIFATIVGLICNWRQERGGAAQDRFQDFITWLSQHHFNELRDQIMASDSLQQELGDLLRLDISLLNSKLDTIVTAISSVADKIEALDRVSRALQASTGALSDQAAYILKGFDQSGETRMVVFAEYGMVHLMPQGFGLPIGDSRFLEDDISSLASLGLISHVDHSRDGDPIYAITRAGSRVAQSMPDVALGPPPEL